MARGKKTSDALRVQVISSLLAGQGIEATAQEYRLPESTIRGIKKAIPQEKFAELRAKKDGELDELIVHYLKTTFNSLTRQVEHFGDARWLKNQTAESVAVLHGVQADKAFRLLEAIQPAEDEQSNAGTKLS